MVANVVVVLISFLLFLSEYKLHSHEIKSTLRSLSKCSILGYPLYFTFNVVVMSVLKLPVKQEYEIIEKIMSALKNGMKIDLGILKIIQVILGIFLGFSIIQCILFFILDIGNHYLPLNLDIDINNIYFGINITSALSMGAFNDIPHVQILCLLLSIMTSPFAYFRVSKIFNKSKDS